MPLPPKDEHFQIPSPPDKNTPVKIRPMEPVTSPYTQGIWCGIAMTVVVAVTTNYFFGRRRASHAGGITYIVGSSASMMYLCYRRDNDHFNHKKNRKPPKQS